MVLFTFSPQHPSFGLGLTLSAGLEEAGVDEKPSLHMSVCGQALTVVAGDVELESVRRVTGNIVSSQLSFLLRPDDNDADYQCNATNDATTQPLVASVTLKVSCAYTQDV